MNDPRNRYALAALKGQARHHRRRDRPFGRKLRHCKKALVHVDATLRLLDQEIDIGAIPNKHPPRRIKLFRQGELGRMILDAFRQTGGEASTSQITTALLEAGGHSEGARRTVASRVRGNLALLERRGKIAKAGNGKGARWRLRETAPPWGPYQRGGAF